MGALTSKPRPGLIGREEELAAVVRLLDARDQLPGVVVLHGEAGIGKTSVWLAGLDAASERGYRVLSTRASEAETQLSFTGLADVLGDGVEEALAELPPVQRRALEAALLLGEPGFEADERAVAAAFLGGLRALAADGPLSLAVDDLQWLDAASLAALRFALSRLGGESVAGLFTVRGDAPGWLRRDVPETSLRRVEIGALSVGAVRELLRTKLGASFPRPTLLRLWETSGGNPFFALELASALQRRGGPPGPGEPLPIPSTLDELLRERLDGLGPAALEVARVVAAVAEPTAGLVEAALGASSDDGVAEALEARIVELDGERLRFTHPLLGSAVAVRQTPSHRRRLHRRLAVVAPTAEERARHLALATDAPSDETAATLEAASRAAQARGALATAAELAEHALRLTPVESDEDARRRLLLAAGMHHAAGDTGRATALLERARAESPAGAGRAALLAGLGAMEAHPRSAEALYVQALAEAHDDDHLEATIRLKLADLMRFREGVDRGLEHAELAVRAATRTNDALLRCRAVAVQELLRFNAGQGAGRAELQEALALERAQPEWPLLSDGPTWVLCHQLVWSADVVAARPLLLEIHDVFKARNDPFGEAFTFWYLGVLEWRAGNWDDADRYASDSVELCAQLGHVQPPDEFPAVIVAAHRGRVAEARARAQAAVAVSEAEGIRVGQAGFSWVLGFIELSIGDPSAALGYLRRAHELREGFLGEPAMRGELADLVEALVATGELDEADDLLSTWEPRARALDRAWVLGFLCRGRGLERAARGDLEAAFASFGCALAEHARSVDPFQHARTLLALGRTQRRAKQRGAARVTLDDALARFETLGAPLWAEQARAELNRISGRAPSRGELTEAERRIAGLVAEGRTNREVAAALFLTEHSVETALTRIYRKLRVRSRAELTRVLSKS